MKKREKFLLAFCISVVVLFIIYYIAAVSAYNGTVNNPKQYLSGETLDNGIEYLKMYFMGTYGVDINSHPEIISVESIVLSTSMVSDTIFVLICCVIVLTTTIYLMMIIKIKSFKEYWKDIFKALIIIICVMLVIQFLNIIHYNFIFFNPNSEVEYEIIEMLSGTLIISLLAWGTMIVGNIVLNIKKLKITGKTKLKE